MVHHRLDVPVSSFETRLATRHHLQDGTILEGYHLAVVATDADNPGSTNLKTDSGYHLRRPTGAVSVRVRSVLTPYFVEAHAEAELDGRTIWKKTWQKPVDDWLPRS